MRNLLLCVFEELELSREERLNIWAGSPADQAARAAGTAPVVAGPCAVMGIRSPELPALLGEREAVPQVQRHCRTPRPREGRGCLEKSELQEEM